MRRGIWTLALLAPLLASAARAAAPASDVDSVVVFADRARVTRVRAATCEHGTAKVVFERLPGTLDARTLHGEVREAADVIGVASELINEEQAADARTRALQAEERKINADIRAEEARKAQAAAELEDVNAYAAVLGATVAEEMRNPHPDTPTWSKALDAIRARRAAIDGERRAADVALRGLQLDQVRVARQLEAVGPGSARAYRNATMTIACRARAEVTALLSYVVPGATWQPEYDLDFAPRGHTRVGPGTARLTVGAVVRQATGEDWQGVRLALSTARPKLGAEAPRPAPLVVDGGERRTEKVLVQASERREQLQGGGPAGGAGPAAAGLDDKGNAFVLTLPHRVTVVADGRPVWSPVDVVEAQATSKLVTVPKLDEHVYQVVSLNNPASYPLLDGRVRSYRGGSYIGDAQLRYHGVGEPLEVSLGIDDELKIERKTLDDRDRDASFLSSTKHMARSYRLILTNRAATAETVELRENIPVSQVDDVKVELDARRTTAGYTLDARRGFLTWPVSLGSGEGRTLDLAYEIHLPDAWVVPGR
jgi:uncharacterized protein (TIGR02231 family)